MRRTPRVLLGVGLLVAIVAPAAVVLSSTEVDGPAHVALVSVAERGSSLALTEPPPPPPPPPVTAGQRPPAPSRPEYDACVTLDPDPVDQWRRALGLRVFTRSETLRDSACDWSLQLARNRALSHGAFNEVVHRGSRFGQAFDGWRASAPHYRVLTTSDQRVTAIGCGTVRAHYPDGAIVFWSTCRMNY